MLFLKKRPSLTTGLVGFGLAIAFLGVVWSLSMSYSHKLKVASRDVENSLLHLNESLAGRIPFLIKNPAELERTILKKLNDFKAESKYPIDTINVIIISKQNNEFVPSFALKNNKVVELDVADLAPQYLSGFGNSSFVEELEATSNKFAYFKGTMTPKPISAVSPSGELRDQISDLSVVSELQLAVGAFAAAYLMEKQHLFPMISALPLLLTVIALSFWLSRVLQDISTGM